jgi:hypothetical protein
MLLVKICIVLMALFHGGRVRVPIQESRSSKAERIALIQRWLREIQDRLTIIPGVRGVSSATYAPMSGDQWGHDVRIQGKPEPGPKDDVSSDWTRITPGFFDTIGAPHNLGSGTAP